ncbi:unnamed protein product [Medioppia subpectinata]|uniref:Uncharacterized protein n=1 Tax=Medioppia subpectinata TaxID=1979941 RepID=A0A7R9KSI5_9ACAR|nr:unnamed protein product [Medioppia subpectinata]CAG2109040.1 unnamed protein product [Medioppia subpectinata]
MAIQKMSESEESPKLCGVCGDKALGKNFCALSCESCKAFFRRNASNYHKMKCYYGEKCEINLETRTVCRKCRLKKCFAIGMRKEWILNDEEKEVRKRKIQNNRHKRVSNNHNNECRIVDKIDESTNSSYTPSMFANSNDISDKMDILEMIGNGNKNNVITVNAESLSTQIIEMQTNMTEETDISVEAYRKALELEMAVIPMARPLTSGRFNETESMRFTELISVTEVFRTPIPKCTSQVCNFTDAVTVLMSKCDEEVREVVKAFKQLNAFRTLCQSDQILLLKYSAIQMICMRAVVCYDDDTEHWSIPLDDDNSTLVQLKFLKGYEKDLYSPMKRFLCVMGKEYDSDETILDLMTAIVLFGPEHPDLIHKEAIKLQQQVYMYLLQRYLQMKYGSECVAKCKFIRLMNGLSYANKLHQKYIVHFLDAIPSDISPLLNEICDRRPQPKAITFTLG